MEGEKTALLTPVPEKIPPLGCDELLKLKLAAVLQKVLVFKFNVTPGSAFTMVVALVEAEQLLLEVKA